MSQKCLILQVFERSLMSNRYQIFRRLFFLNLYANTKCHILQIFFKLAKNEQKIFFGQKAPYLRADIFKLTKKVCLKFIRAQIFMNFKHFYELNIRQILLKMLILLVIVRSKYELKMHNFATF